MPKTVFFALILLSVVPNAACADFVFAEPPRSAEDVYLWPASLHLGYGGVFDAHQRAHAFTLGLDLINIAHDSLLIDVFSARVAFRDACAGEREGCGMGGDIFLGTRVAYAGYFGRHRLHQLSIGAALGWGVIAGGFSGRVGSGDGQLVFAPSLRYAAFGQLGLEVALMFPLSEPFGRAYPAAIMLNLYGLGGVIVAALSGGGAFF